MAATITCTPGGSADNSYVTAAQVTAHFTGTLREETWLAYTADQRARAIIQATAMIEAQGGAVNPGSPSRAKFRGEPYDASTPQALHFPRGGDIDSAGAVEVPKAIRDAVCEQAYYLLGQLAGPPLVDFAELRARGVSNISQDGLSVTLGARDTPDDGLAPAVWPLLKPYIVTSYRVA